MSAFYGLAAVLAATPPPPVNGHVCNTDVPVGRIVDCSAPSTGAPPGSPPGAGIVGGLVKTAIQPLVSLVVDSASKMYESLLGLFVKVRAPVLDDNLGAVGFLRTHTMWLVAFVAVFGLMAGAIKLAMNSGEGGADAGKALLRLVFVVSYATVLVEVTVLGGDAFSQWILADAQASYGGAPGSGLATAAGAIGVGGMLILAPIAFLAAVAGVVTVIGGNVLLVFVCGVGLPVTAAWSGTEPGHTAYRKIVGLTITLVALKPVMACLLATSEALVKQPDNVSAVTGIVGLMMVSFAGPALYRIVAPAAVEYTGASGRASVASASMLAATGARYVSAAIPSHGGGSQAAAAGPTGAALPGPPGAAAGGSAGATGAAGASGAGAAGAGAGAAAAPVAGAVVLAKQAGKAGKWTASRATSNGDGAGDA